MEEIKVKDEETTEIIEETEELEVTQETDELIMEVSEEKFDDTLVKEYDDGNANDNSDDNTRIIVVENINMKRPKVWTKEKREIAKNMHKIGKSPLDIAAATELKVKTIEKFLKKHFPTINNDDETKEKKKNKTLAKQRLYLTNEKIELLKCLRKNGASTNEIATVLGVSLRTVQRFIAKNFPNEDKSQMRQKSFSVADESNPEVSNTEIIKVESKKRIWWTKEKYDTAKRLLSSGARTVEIANATGVSVRSVQRFLKENFPDDIGDNWYEFMYRKRRNKKAALKAKHRDNDNDNDEDNNDSNAHVNYNDDDDDDHNETNNINVNIDENSNNVDDDANNGNDDTNNADNNVVSIINIINNDIIINDDVNHEETKVRKPRKHKPKDPNGHKRTRWTPEKVETARRLCANGFKPRDIAMAIGMSLRSAQKFYAETFPDDVGGEWKDFAINQKPLGRKESGEKKDLREKLIDILSSGCSTNLQSVNEYLPENLRRSTTVLSRELKKIKWSKKRLQNPSVDKNSQEIMNERLEFIAGINDIHDTSKVYFDEMGFFIKQPKYGWAPEDTVPNIQMLSHQRNLTLLAAIGVNGCIAFDISEGPYTIELFEDFIINRLIPNLTVDSIIIMERIKYYDSPNVDEALRQSNIGIKFLPQFSPQLNPMTDVLAMVKDRYREAKPRPNDTEQLRENVEKIVNDLSVFTFENLYENTRSFHSLALNLLPFPF